MTLEKRHKDANKTLKTAAAPHLRKKPQVQILRVVARKVGVNDRTVKNYLDGYGKDGFLTEAITDVFKSL